MRMDVGLDTGPVYVQQAISIAADETAASLHDKLAELGAAMLEEHLADIAAGNLSTVPQNDGEATYAPLIKKEDGQLDWAQPAMALERRIRAMTPWPGAFTYWQGQLLKILAAEVVDGRLPSGTPGQVAAWEETAVVLTGDGGLALQTIQLAGKRAMAVSDFLRGRPELIGSTLGDSSGIA
jgi:methionyl-tRNA formyltransferase